jgi:hypothetical protein
MKKLYLIMLLITSCGYNPVIDTAGKSGSFDESRADQITNDLQHCKTLAKENTPVYEPLKYAYNWYVRPQLLWFPDKAEYSYKAMVNKCLTNRGHSIITGE